MAEEEAPGAARPRRGWDLPARTQRHVPDPATWPDAARRRMPRTRRICQQDRLSEPGGPGACRGLPLRAGTTGRRAEHWPARRADRRTAWLPDLQPDLSPGQAPGQTPGQTPGQLRGRMWGRLPDRTQDRSQAWPHPLGLPEMPWPLRRKLPSGLPMQRQLVSRRQHRSLCRIQRQGRSRKQGPHRRQDRYGPKNRRKAGRADRPRAPYCGPRMRQKVCPLACRATFRATLRAFDQKSATGGARRSCPPPHPPGGKQPCRQCPQRRERSPRTALLLLRRIRGQA